MEEKSTKQMIEEAIDSLGLNCFDTTPDGKLYVDPGSSISDVEKEAVILALTLQQDLTYRWGSNDESIIVSFKEAKEQVPSILKENKEIINGLEQTIKYSSIKKEELLRFNKKLAIHT